jgi:hypothetical protein
MLLALQQARLHQRLGEHAACVAVLGPVVSPALVQLEARQEALMNSAGDGIAAGSDRMHWPVAEPVNVWCVVMCTCHTLDSVTAKTVGAGCMHGAGDSVPLEVLRALKRRSQLAKRNKRLAMAGKWQDGCTLVGDVSAIAFAGVCHRPRSVFCDCISASAAGDTEAGIFRAARRRADRRKPHVVAADNAAQALLQVPGACCHRRVLPE